MANQLLPIPSIPIVGDARGTVSREWWRWFSQLAQAVIPSDQSVNQLSLIALSMGLVGMALASSVLFGPIILTTGPTILYQSPAGMAATITRAFVTNISAGGATINIWLVRAGKPFVNNTMIVGATAQGLTIPTGPSDGVVINALTGLVLAPGDAIYGVSNTVGALNIVASGWTQ